MHVVVGASGQVGSGIIKVLGRHHQSVRGLIRNKEKAKDLKEGGADVVVVNLCNRDTVADAFAGADTVLLMTPESNQTKDMLSETEQLLDNYRYAVEKAGVKRLVGLSSMGAQHSHRTGNLLMSHMLENAFAGMDVETVFIRPAYYFSNWMLYLPVIRETGKLPSFYPQDLVIPMIAPNDVAHFAAEVLIGKHTGNLFEISGPRPYTPAEVSKAFANALKMEVDLTVIPRNEWANQLREAGFSGDATENFVAMTASVVDGRSSARAGQEPRRIKSSISLQQFIDDAIGC